jgi:adhesin transport system outer membrane protein
MQVGAAFGAETLFYEPPEPPAPPAAASAPASPPVPDVVSLPALLRQAAEHHPAIRGARLDADAAAQDVASARLARWPTVSATMETHGSNVATSSSRALNVEQTLWDAGRVRARIAEASSLAEVSRTRLLAVRQSLWLEVVAAWQSQLAAQGRAEVARKTLQRLDNYRAIMRRRVEAQASPVIELELVDARIVQTQVELNQAEAARAMAVARLAQLSGWSGLQERLLPAMADAGPVQSITPWLQGLALETAALDSPSVAMARFDAEAARSRLAAKEAEKYPQVYARVSQPIGSRVVSGDRGAAVFVGLRYTPGAGFSNWSESRSLSLRAQSADEAVESARREVVYALDADRAELSAAVTRLAAAEGSVSGSELVLASYLRQFQGARKTWQDVLNAARELAQNEYARIDVQATLVGALARLQVRLGRSADGIGSITQETP